MPFVRMRLYQASNFLSDFIEKKWFLVEISFFVLQLDFVEFAIALGTMIRGEDEAKLELAFEILSPLKSTRKRERLGQELTATDGDCYSDRNMGSLKCSKFTGRGSISSPSGRPLSPYPSPVTAKQNSKNGTSEQDGK